MNSICEHVVTYFSRPPIVFVDVILFILAVASIGSILMLRRRTEDLSVAIQQLHTRITKG